MTNDRVRRLELDNLEPVTDGPVNTPDAPPPLVEPELLDAPRDLVYSEAPQNFRDMSLSDLRSSLDADALCKRDEVAKVDAIAADVTPEGEFRILFHPAGEDKARHYRPTATALGQFSERGNMPAGVTHSLMQLGNNDLAAEAINRGLTKVWEGNGEKTFLIRRRENGDASVRAVLSDKYAPLDTDLVVGIMDDLLSEEGTASQVERLHWDGDNFRAQVTFPSSDFSVANDSDYRLGFNLTNNEVGGGAVTFHAMVWRLVCVNGLMAWDSVGGFRQVHRGLVDQHDLKRDIARCVEACLPQSQALAEKLIAAQQTPIPNIGQVIAQLSIDNKLGKPVAAQWMQGYDQEALAARVSGGTAFGIVNGLTRSARSVGAVQASALERTAGRMLSNTNWARTSERAAELDPEQVFAYVGVA